MAAKHWILFIASFVLLSFVKAQNKTADSANTASIFKKLLLICKNKEELSKGNAAPYIVYRGEDKKRAWKSICNYSNEEDKKRVDEICTNINKSANLDSNYTIVRYFTEKESEGVWHVLIVEYKKNEVLKKAAYAFLKLGNHFCLGDIDLYYN